MNHNLNNLLNDPFIIDDCFKTLFKLIRCKCIRYELRLQTLHLRLSILCSHNWLPLQCLQLYFILCSHISLPHISDKYSFVYYVRKMNYHYSLDNNSFVFHVHTFHYHHRLNTDFFYYVHIFQSPPHGKQRLFRLPWGQISSTA
jgi:hypothetical protein